MAFIAFISKDKSGAWEICTKQCTHSLARFPSHDDVRDRDWIPFILNAFRISSSNLLPHFAASHTNMQIVSQCQCSVFASHTAEKAVVELAYQQFGVTSTCPSPRLSCLNLPNFTSLTANHSSRVLSIVNVDCPPS